MAFVWQNIRSEKHLFDQHSILGSVLVGGPFNCPRHPINWSFWALPQIYSFPDVTHIGRSSRNDDHEIFVEISRLDLERQYGDTEAGRRVVSPMVRNIMKHCSGFSILRSCWYFCRKYLEKLFASQKGRAHPQACILAIFPLDWDSHKNAKNTQGSFLRIFTIFESNRKIATAYRLAIFRLVWHAKKRFLQPTKHTAKLLEKCYRV